MIIAFSRQYFLFSLLAVLIQGCSDPQKQNVSRLIEDLSSASPARRRDAAEKLGQLESKAEAAISSLESSLGDPDSQVRLAAAESLLRIAPANSSSLPTILELLKDQSWKIRSGAVRTLPLAANLALEKANRRRALLALAESAKDSDENVRIACAQALGQTRSDVEIILPALYLLLTDDQPQARVFAIQAIWELGPSAKDATARLVKIMQEDSKLRHSAIQAIGAIGPDARSAVPALIKELNQGDGDSKQFAAQALGKLGPDADDALPYLRNAEQSSDFRLSSVAREAIKSIEKKKSGDSKP